MAGIVSRELSPQAQKLHQMWVERTDKNGLKMLVKDRYISGWATINYLCSTGDFIAHGNVEGVIPRSVIHWVEGDTIWLR